jgi:hypothetical protein
LDEAGVWKLRGISGGLEKGTCPLCMGNDDMKHILLSCPETKKWRMQFMSTKWLYIYEELAYRKINCTNKMHLISSR